MGLCMKDNLTSISKKAKEFTLGQAEIAMTVIGLLTSGVVSEFITTQMAPGTKALGKIVNNTVRVASLKKMGGLWKKSGKMDSRS